MSCDTGIGACVPAPLVRDWRLVERIGSDRAAKGKVVSVDFRSLSAMEGGKHGHIRGLRIVGAVRVTPPGVPNNLATSRHMLRGLIEQIRLSGSDGWHYLDGVNGRSIEDWQFYDGAFFRSQFRQSETEIPANLAEATTYRIDLFIDLARGASFPEERLLPIADIQAREAEACKFRLRDSFPDSGANTLTITEYRQGDETSAGLEIWADVVYLDAPVVPAKWGLREYERVQSSGSFDYPEAAHGFLVARAFAEDAADSLGEDIPSALSGVTLKVGGETVMDGWTQADWATRDRLVQLSEPWSFGSLDTPLSGYALPVEAAAVGNPPALMFLPPRVRQSAPAGRVHYKIATMPAGGRFRVLHFFWLCGDGDREQSIKDATGVKNVDRVQRAPDGSAVKVAAGVNVDKTGPTVLVPKG